MLSFRRITVRLLALFALSGFGGAALSARNTAEKPANVDAGSFGIFVRGQRVATETFRIQQGATVSTATSEFKMEQGETKVAHRSELQITTAGDLRHYEWRELSPGKAQLVVEPSDSFLVERIIPNPPEKPIQRPFTLPASTMILDDYCFSHREILAWRYLAQVCGNNLAQCRPAPTQFGVLAPQQRSSLTVTIEYTGLQKVAIRGTEQQLSQFRLKIDDVEWMLYLDGSLKLIRISIPTEETEIVRDPS